MADPQGSEPSAPDESGDASHPWVGKLIDGRYRIESLLAEGGMGSVFVAKQVNLDRKVALKTIRQEWLGHGEAAARFQREALACAKIDHPHVVAALDYFELDDDDFKGAFFVSPLVQGTDLRTLIHEKRLDRKRAWQIAAQVADAMHAAHAMGVVHRDIKPENILVEDHGGKPFARVLDFGLARINPGGGEVADGATLTQVGTVMGTPGYMAPEQAMGQEVDERTDIYALGVVLWEMLLGTHPFPGDDLTTIVTRQLTLAPDANVAGERLQIGDAPAQLLSSLLQPKAEDRPQDAASVRDALRSTDASPTVRGPRSPFTPRRNVVIAAGVLCLGLVLAWTLGTSDEESETDSDESAAEAPSVPPAVAERVKTLLLNRTANQRRRAAKWLDNHEPKSDVPEYAQHLVTLELNPKRCETRTVALLALQELGDHRALPFLERLSRSRARGCGFLGLQECNRCIRKRLKETIQSLEKRK